jgi:hypothetical protein
LTVLLLDSDIATAGPGHALWFALESVALHTNEETTCFRLQHFVVTDDNDDDTVYQNVYHQSLPAFRKAIEHYRVRVSSINAKMYNIQTSSSSSNNDDDENNKNAAFMNINYWKQEFHSDDTDELLLILTADSVLCRDLNTFNYSSKYAWVSSAAAV